MHERSRLRIWYGSEHERNAMLAMLRSLSKYVAVFTRQSHPASLGLSTLPAQKYLCCASQCSVWSGSLQSSTAVRPTLVTGPNAAVTQLVDSRIHLAKLFIDGYTAGSFRGDERIVVPEGIVKGMKGQRKTPVAIKEQLRQLVISRTGRAAHTVSKKLLEDREAERGLCNQQWCHDVARQIFS